MSRVLVIAPHADDETLGMGGTIARLAGEGATVTIAIMTGHGRDPHPIWPEELWTTIRAEAREATSVLGVSELIFDELPAACLDHHPVHDINARVAALVERVNPEALYLPYYHDMHRDHTMLAYAGLVASRAYRQSGIRRVAMYETPTETHLMPSSIAPPFAPTLYVDITSSMETKLAAWRCYASQQLDGITPRTPAVLKALAQWRGAHAGVEFAEAFHLIYEAA